MTVLGSTELDDDQNRDWRCSGSRAADGLAAPVRAQLPHYPFSGTMVAFRSKQAVPRIGLSGWCGRHHRSAFDMDALQALVAATRAEPDAAIAACDHALSRMDRQRHFLRQLQRVVRPPPGED